jgi:hypothetical protein
MSEFLKGKTINAIKIADDKKALLFICGDGEHMAKADGDCCSDTWIESVELPAMGFPAVVMECGDIPMPDHGQPDEYELIQYYGYKISTDKGDIVIDYRNSSNGYYGGNLSWPDDNYFYGGVHGQNISSQDWREIA